MRSHPFRLRNMRSYILLLPALLLLLSTPALSHSYTYKTFAQMQLRLRELADAYPDILRMYSAQTRFSLPHVGNCTQITTRNESTGTQSPCTIWILELSNFKTLPDDPYRPEMLISGELHGDEIIGPHAVLAFIELMTGSYNADPHIKRMLDTRLITLIPTTNAIGFERRERAERQSATPAKLLDPNRDFPFNQSPGHCMQTVAGRALNELFRIHLFRLLITFHGGTNVIGYEWGDNFHCEGSVCKKAPDTLLMSALATRMSANAGPAAAYEGAYPVGDMGKLVYPVNGGLEDWAYGASWAGQAVVCDPENLGGYPKEKTKIDSATKRCVTYLVETGREKAPEDFKLGGWDSVLQRGAEQDGHIPRNVRLLMSAVDSIEPYVLLHRNVTADDSKRPVLSWRVGGAFAVDGTMLQWSTMGGEHYGQTEVLNGTAGVAMAGSVGTLFNTAMHGEFPNPTKSVFCRVVTVVDQPYTKQPEGSSPNVTPQSHLMGSRASDKWEFSVGEHKIRGSLVFYSETVRIEEPQTGLFTIAAVTDVEWGEAGEGKLFSGSQSDIFQMLVGNGDRDGVSGVTMLPTGGSSLGPWGTFGVGAVAVLVIVAIAIIIYMFARRRRQRRSRIKSHDVFAIVDEEELEERTALASFDEEAARDFEAEEVLSVPPRR